MSALQSVDDQTNTEISAAVAARNWGNSMRQEGGRFAWLFKPLGEGSQVCPLRLNMVVHATVAEARAAAGIEGRLCV